MIDKESAKLANEIVSVARRQMDKTLEHLSGELAAIGTGRASISILDHVQVDCYGVPTPINQVAQLGTPDATLITVQPYDVSLVGPIEKVIRGSDLGLNPSSDGRIVRIPIPPLTEERRKSFLRKVQIALEDHRTAIRNIRREEQEQILKKYVGTVKRLTLKEIEQRYGKATPTIVGYDAGGPRWEYFYPGSELVGTRILEDNLDISVDDKKKALEEIQKITDDYIRKLEEAAKHKEQQIMKV